MLTKVGDPSCLKTEVGGKQGHALRKTQCTKNYFMKEFVKELAPSPRQLLNEQGVRRISGLQKFESLEIGMLEVFVEEVRKCVNK